VLVSGEGLHRGSVDVLGTLLHEAAHGLAHARKVSDTSRQSRYHNCRYATLAAELGLEVAHVQPVGWSATSVALAPSPGGCRCAAGGTPDPCPRDHPTRPGVKLEPRRSLAWPSGRPSGRRWRPRRNELDAGVCRAGWYSRRARASAERGRVQGPASPRPIYPSPPVWSTA
jgi:hypothetical protein